MGSVGLAVTQSNTLTLMLQHGARMLVEFLAQLTSVERILEYTRIDTEPDLFQGSQYHSLSRTYINSHIPHNIVNL